MGIGAPSSQDSQIIASSWLGTFEKALVDGHAAALARLFTPDAYWRDILALTWDLRTFSGATNVSDQLMATRDVRSVSNLVLDRGSLQAFTRKLVGPTIEVFFDFSTDIAECRGHVRLRPVHEANGEWLAWTLFTSMQDLKGHEERVGLNRPDVTAPDHGRFSPWLPAEDHSAKYEVEDPEVLVIGGAQTGLAVAARLGALDVPTLVVEKEARIGDVWRNRYQSLVLHNQIWANHFPYMPFPASWPTYITKDQLAEWIELYARAMSIATWTSSVVESNAYDVSTGRWTIAIRRADGTISTVRPRHLVMATGVFGKAKRIAIEGAERFGGKILSAADVSDAIDAKDKRVLVVGSGSSAHDVSRQLHDCGARVTLLQRGSTCVVSLEPGAIIPYSIYGEMGMPVEQADMLGNSIPFPLLSEMHKEMTRQIAELDKDLIARLNAAGFATNQGDDGSGFLLSFFRKGGGYYINVGTSDLIVNGAIAVKGRSEIAYVEGMTVHFTDGDSRDFDLIVMAIGYENMQESIRDILGDDVANRVGPVWGLDEEGELRNMWKRTGQPGLWIAGGSLQQNRPFSKYLALQIKADQLNAA